MQTVYSIIVVSLYRLQAVIMCVSVPESPRDIVIGTQEAPKENEAEITWTRTYYSFVELTCNQQCCGENRFFRVSQ